MLELDRDRHHDLRRTLRGWGWVVTVEDAVYEMLEDNSLKFLGDPRALEGDEIKERVREVLGTDWVTTKDVVEGLDEPQPSQEAVRLALLSLVKDGTAERNPPLTEGVQQRGKAHKWRSTQSWVPTIEPLVLQSQI